MKHFLHTKKYWIYFFAVSAAMICICAGAVSISMTIFKNKQSLPEAVKTSVYNDITTHMDKTQTTDPQAVQKMVMSSIDALFKEVSVELSDRQRMNIQNTLDQLTTSLDHEEMIVRDDDGDLTELSKAYLANAASCAVASETGDKKVSLPDDQITDSLTVSDEVDKAVKKIKSSCRTVSKQLADANETSLDLSDMKKQLDALEKGMADKNKEQISASKLALRLDALETMVGTLKSSINKSVRTSLKAADSSTDEILVNLNKEISDRKAAVSALKKDLDGISQTSTQSINAIKESVDHNQQSLSDYREAANENKQDLTGDLRVLEQALTKVQNQVSSNNRELYQYLDSCLEKELDARTASAGALELQIRSGESEEAERDAEKISGSTVFAKLGSLFKRTRLLEQTDEWAQNVTLSHTSSSGTKIYGMQEAGDSDHMGWKMWKLDADSLGVTLHEAGGQTPESEVVINYAGTPELIVEYRIAEGYLYIYTPSAPEGDLLINSIHVQNCIQPENM